MAAHGFPSGALDGHFGASTGKALRKFQRWAGLQADGVAGAAVVAALRTAPPSCPISLSSPVGGAYSDAFGPRGNRFHTGSTIAAAGERQSSPQHRAESPSRASAGGWGRLVTIAHGGGTRTMYAHLSLVGVRVGQYVQSGQRIGRVGSSGNSTGPHLHFEVRVRGAAVDPMTGL